MDIFITKYALTVGIQRVVADPAEEYGDGAMKKRRTAGYDSGLVFRREYATNAEAAIADAERRRAAKIASLRKQIAKLEKLTFTVPVASPAEPA